MTNKESLLKFIAFIKQVVTRPAMFGVDSVKDIYFISFGYKTGLNHSDSSVVADFLYEFRCFVNQQYGFKDENSWHIIIQEKSVNSGEALELFKDLFDSFSQTNK